MPDRAGCLPDHMRSDHDLVCYGKAYHHDESSTEHDSQMLVDHLTRLLLPLGQRSRLFQGLQIRLGLLGLELDLYGLGFLPLDSLHELLAVLQIGVRDPGADGPGCD